MLKCPECGRDVQNARALGAHRRWRHGVRSERALKRERKAERGALAYLGLRSSATVNNAMAEIEAEPKVKVEVGNVGPQKVHPGEMTPRQQVVMTKLIEEEMAVCSECITGMEKSYAKLKKLFKALQKGSAQPRPLSLSVCGTAAPGCDGKTTKATAEGGCATPDATDEEE